MTAETPLRLLLAEDDAADAELCLAALRSAGLQVQADLVVTPEEFERAIEAGSYDLLLADYHLPCWPALDVLTLVNERGLDLPVIVVSGQIGEEAAVDCIRRGASDCVLKDRLPRLPLVVRRVLEERRLRAQRTEAEQARHALEERYRQLVERSLAGMFRVTLDGRLLDANPALARMLGYEHPADLLARDPGEFYWSEQDRVRLRAEIQCAGSLASREVRLRRRDGSPVWVLANAALIPAQDGGPALVEATLIDISERKRAEQEILELNRLYSVVSHMDQAIACIRERGPLLEEACRIAVQDGGFGLAWFGLAGDDGLLRPAAHFGMDADHLAQLRGMVEPDGPTSAAWREGRESICNDITAAPLWPAWREGALHRGFRSAAAFPIRVQERLAGVLTLYAAAPGAFNQSGTSLLQQLAAHVSFALENMEREAQHKRADYERARLFASEQAARAQARAEVRFRELLEAAPDAILEVDREGRIVLLNRASEALFDYPREQLLGQPLEVLVPEALRAEHVAHRTAFLQAPSTRTVQPGRDVWARRRDGTEFPVEISLSPVASAEGDLVTCIVRDITHRKRAEEALRESNRQIVSTLESITDAFFALDRDWRFTYLNSKAEQIIGRRRDELLGKRIWEEFRELGGTVFEQRYRQAAAEQRPAEFTAFHPVAGIWAEAHVYPSERGLSIYLHNISARKQLEEQFQQAQKMEALGRLAGGVAHDFNNLLTIIGGYGHMVMEALEPRHPLRKDLEAIVEAADRASALTRQLLAFSRRQHVQPKVLELNRFVKRMHRILRRLIGEDVDIRLLLAADLGRVRADPGQIEQVIMNLAVNARDAMPGGGTLTIQTANLEVEHPPDQPQAGLPPGSYVTLSITDTGTGMDPQTRSHIFEPFFTTKPKGKGTGLGLSTVYGVVKQSGGEVEVETEPGRGSTFRICLPRVKKQAPAKRRAGSHRSKTSGGETILLVEDELEVRKLAREMLLRQGYRVLDAGGGPEAIQLWEQQPGGVDLLLTDVIMPQMSGRQLADRLAARQPGLKVLYISGYSDDVVARHGILDPKTELLPKPFTREVLGARVRRVLEDVGAVDDHQGTGRE